MKTTTRNAITLPAPAPATATMSIPADVTMVPVSTRLSRQEARQVTAMVERALEAGLPLADALRAAEMVVCWESTLASCTSASARCEEIILRSCLRAGRIS